MMLKLVRFLRFDPVCQHHDADNTRYKVRIIAESSITFFERYVKVESSAISKL